MRPHVLSSFSPCRIITAPAISFDSIPRGFTLYHEKIVETASTLQQIARWESARGEDSKTRRGPWTRGLGFIFFQPDVSSIDAEDLSESPSSRRSAPHSQISINRPITIDDAILPSGLGDREFVKVVSIGLYETRPAAEAD